MPSVRLSTPPSVLSSARLRPSLVFKNPAESTLTGRVLPGVRVSDIARKYDATRWQIYTWRKRLRKGELVLSESAASLPFFAQLVAGDDASRGDLPEESVQGAVTEEAGKSGMTEIVLGDAVIRVSGHMDEAQLTRIIRAVRAAAP